ncbi:MAG: helix-turn-helix domain-containing protein [Bacillota bacterium]
MKKIAYNARNSPDLAPDVAVSEGLSRRLRLLRARYGFTLQDVQTRTGIPLSTLDSYENSYYPPSPPVLLRLAGFYHVTTDWLLTGRDDARAWPEGYATFIRLAKTLNLRQRRLLLERLRQVEKEIAS